MKGILVLCFFALLKVAYSQHCIDGQFQCDNDRCISGFDICNGEDDCGDGSDEKENPLECPCPSGYFLCKDGMQCIYHNLVCDGRYSDCNDGMRLTLKLESVQIAPERIFNATMEDVFPIVLLATDSIPVEMEAMNLIIQTIARPKERYKNKLRCDDGQCIRNTSFCNGFVSCRDGSDEPSDPEKCPACVEGQWRCNNGHCIDETERCNNEDDCYDNSDEPTDEALCPACLDDKWRCKDGRCIWPDYVCNGERNCADGSDELDEAGKCPSCPDTVHACPNGRCVRFERLCDAKNDCGDWEDESEVNCPCADNEYRCAVPPGEEPGKPGVCIPAELVCDPDGIWDCPTGSDESNCTIQSGKI